MSADAGDGGDTDEGDAGLERQALRAGWWDCGLCCWWL
jgi:hypothetical protein